MNPYIIKITLNCRCYDEDNDDEDFGLIEYDMQFRWDKECYDDTIEYLMTPLRRKKEIIRLFETDEIHKYNIEFEKTYKFCSLIEILEQIKNLLLTTNIGIINGNGYTINDVYWNNTSDLTINIL